MKRFFVILLLFMAACAPSDDHKSKIEAYRRRLPYQTVIGRSHSMQPALMSGQVYTVIKFDYDNLSGGLDAVFLPAGSMYPVCHRIGSRVGTDSWSTYGISNGPGDDTFRWILTRDNYIGIIK